MTCDRYDREEFALTADLELYLDNILDVLNLPISTLSWVIMDFMKGKRSEDVTEENRRAVSEVTDSVRYG